MKRFMSWLLSLAVPKPAAKEHIEPPPPRSPAETLGKRTAEIVELESRIIESSKANKLAAMVAVRTSQQAITAETRTRAMLGGLMSRMDKGK